ncbi:hypothetical protein BGZ63DRAFT_346706 [Mariannaea sp. PMI_226]|nr:hypothetical protein BGZ63DRAFT_346706 [Mariannaea sp. PMI_226]
MSAPGPESIPTSADPRSHRPTKRRALTPVSAQAASVDALFAKPDQRIHVPDGNAPSSTRRPPPEIVSNVQGSSAGAGSGEFHVYKASRRREYERLREMDVAVKTEQDREEFDKNKADRDRKDEERTRKNREKREKMKARKAKKGKGPSPNGGTKPSTTSPLAEAQAANGTEDDSKEKDSAAQNSENKKADDTPTASAESLGLVIHDEDD